jgi:Tol biopolymer transport system component
MRAVGPLDADGIPATVGIFVVKLQDRSFHQLTQLQPNSGTEDHAPSWSPDGTRLVFQRTNNMIEPVLASALYTIRADGTRLQRLTLPGAPDAGEPAWSPDGSTIAFSSDCLFGSGCPGLGGSADIYTIRPDGTCLRQLTHNGGTIKSASPSWSPDGSRIVFWTRDPASLGLATIRRDGGDERQVTMGLDAHPDWGR